MSRVRLDVAIVGGSASGFFAAGLLARAGRSVTLLERSRHLDPMPRTLIVTHRMRDILGELGEGSVVNEIRRFELFADGKAATVPLDQPDLIIERSRLIEDLHDDAVGSGVEVKFGSRFLSLGPSGPALAVTTVDKDRTKNEATADVVIGADGTQSRVARSAGWPAQPSVSLVQALVELPPDIPPDTSRVWFRPAETPYFYWLIPESDQRAALGIIGDDGPASRRHLDAFMERQGLVPLGYQAATIPAYRGWIPNHRKVGSGDVYLIGDAAGQVKVSTVGGIVTGFRGAMGAADQILDRPSRHLASLKRELDLHLLLRKSLHRFTEDDYRYVISRLGGSASNSLGTRSRDEAGRVMMAICRTRPTLVLRGLRSLLLRSGARYG